MIGLQKYIVDNNIQIVKLAKEMNISPSTIHRWFNVNKVPENYHELISTNLKINKEYINKKINNISTYKPRCFNNYKIIDDYVEIYIVRRNGDKYTVYIDLEDLEKIKNYNNRIHVGYHKNIDGYYAEMHKYIGIINGKSKYKTLLLHRIVTDAIENEYVDHIKHKETLNNRKYNLRKTTNDKNLQSRKGANKNSSTGIRNVNYIEKLNEYWVQIMKKGERFKWIFPSNQFKEACDFAEKKRKELFGEYAGKG